LGGQGRQLPRRKQEVWGIEVAVKLPFTIKAVCGVVYLSFARPGEREL